VSNGDGSAAQAYHDRTKHSAASVRSGRHFLDWENQPRPFKIYATLQPVPTPTDLAPIDMPALDAIATVTSGTGDATIPDLARLTQILRLSAGITKRRPYPGGEMLFRAPACTGALYHIDLYVVCGDLPGLPAGVYHYGPHDNGLACLRAGDHRGTLAAATGQETAVVVAPVTLACASTYWRNAWKYQARAYRHCFWDGGTLLAHTLAVAAAQSMPARVVVGFVDDTVNALLDLDGIREAAIALVPLGHSTVPAPAPGPTPTPLDLATLRLSTREVDYPAIQEIHAASAIATPEEAAAWHDAGPAAARARRAPTGTVVSIRPHDDATRAPDRLDRVIRRRASTRVFAHEPIAFDTLSTLLACATRGVPTDCLHPPGTTGNELYLIVNAVDGLAPGAYAFDRATASLELLRTGSFREEARHLGLGQALPADASVNIFVLADLAPVLEHCGDRGYRAAALEAGIIGGKLYLAAYAQRLGATGLTFFDDDVTDFFSPHAAGKSVMFLMAVGVPATRPGTR
jgi:SagB-type dehydrogenase family enzyme